MSETSPRLSVIVLADRYSTISRAVESLLHQSIAAEVELVVGCPSPADFGLPTHVEQELAGLVHGVPVVASRGGGHDGTVEDGISGLLFPAGDVDALAQCLADVACGRVFAGGSPPEAVRAIRATHDLDRHIAWLRTIIADVHDRAEASGVTTVSP